jgi:transposase
MTEYINVAYDMQYTVSGVQALVKRLNFVYKKPHRCPRKANPEAQEVFIKKYRKISASIGAEDSLLFMDTVHPQHQTHIEYGWIKKGETKIILTTASQPRLNINGALDIKKLDVITHFQKEMITKETVKCFLTLIRKKRSEGKIYLVCDKARYYHNQDVQAHAKQLKITLLYLPPYSPNLNLIERVWLFFKKKVLYNRFFLSFSEFEESCRNFFRAMENHRESLRTLLTENFQRCRPI